MKIVLAYLEEKVEQTKETLSNAKKMNCNKKYIKFLESKEKQFSEALRIISETVA